MVMQPPSQPNNTPGSGEPDMSPMPQQGSSMQPSTGEDDMSPMPASADAQTGNGGIQQRLDALPDHDKQFLSQYLTPEFVYAIGLVSGPEAAQYLNQFTDQNKVLVPVSRQEAARIQQEVKAYQQQGQGAPGGQPQGQPQAAPQGQPQQPQGQPQQAPQSAQGAPQMKPQAMPQAQPQQLPNGVTPAPMQHGVMAPR